MTDAQIMQEVEHALLAGPPGAHISHVEQVDDEVLFRVDGKPYLLKLEYMGS